MKAKLKDLHSPDIDLDSFKPREAGNFMFLLQAFIGPDNKTGDESFDFQVCTPDWLKSNHSKAEVLFGRHLLIVFEYDLPRIRGKISKYCESCVGDTWQDIAEKLSRIGGWEFEDFKP